MQTGLASNDLILEIVISFLPDWLKKRKPPDYVWQLLLQNLPPDIVGMAGRDAALSFSLDAQGGLDKRLYDSCHKRGKQWDNCTDAPKGVAGVKEILGREDIGENIRSGEKKLE